MAIAKLPNLLFGKGAPLTAQDLVAVKQQVQSLPSGGVWAPADINGMYWGVVAGGQKLLLVPGQPALLPDDNARQQMSNAAAFAGFAPEYVLRLVDEIQNLQLQLQQQPMPSPGAAGGQANTPKQGPR